MRRRLVMGLICLGLVAPTARAQMGFTNSQLPTHTALERLGLERQWAGAVPLGAVTESVIRISLAGQGVNDWNPAQVVDSRATTTRFMSRSNLSTDDDYYKGLLLKFTNGPNQDAEGRIESYSAKTRTFRFLEPFANLPTDGDTFEISGLREKVTGQVLSIPPTVKSVVIDRPAGDPSGYVGSTLVFTSGSLAGQGRTIVGYDPAARMFTFQEDFASPPAGGDTFIIHGLLIFVQTDHANFHAFDAETGRYLWGVNLGARMLKAQPAQVSADQVFVTSGKTLFSFDRRTGREIWHVLLDDIASSPTAADENAVIVGMTNGKVTAFSIHDRKVDNLVIPGGSVLFNWKTDKIMTGRPIIANKVCAFGSQDGRVYVAQIFPPKLVFRFLTEGPIVASMGALGTRTLLAASNDQNLYAIDLYTGETRWIFPSGHPIDQEPLVAGGQILVVNSDGALSMIQPDTGAPIWTTDTGKARLMAVSPTRIYLATPDRELLVYNRPDGKRVFSGRETSERMGLNLRGFDMTLTNRYNDRLYFVSKSGLLVCLREAGKTSPVPLRDPRSEKPFGQIGAPAAKPVVPGAEAPAKPEDGAGTPAQGDTEPAPDEKL